MTPANGPTVHGTTGRRETGQLAHGKRLKVKGPMDKGKRDGPTGQWDNGTTG